MKLIEKYHFYTELLFGRWKRVTQAVSVLLLCHKQVITFVCLYDVRLLLVLCQSLFPSLPSSLLHAHTQLSTNPWRPICLQLAYCRWYRPWGIYPFTKVMRLATIHGSLPPELLKNSWMLLRFLPHKWRKVFFFFFSGDFGSTYCLRIHIAKNLTGWTAI